MKKEMIVLSVLTCLFGASHVQAGTLDVVKSRGFLKCSATQGTPGFSIADDAGHFRGLDVDFCRAVAAAVFGNPDKISIVPLQPSARFPSIQSGEVDILFNTTTETLGRKANNGILFSAVTYYDGQGVMVHAGEVKNIKDLNGATICTNQGSTSEQNLSDYARANGMKNEILAFATQEEALKGYSGGRCDAMSSDRSVLYAFRSALPDPDKHVILPETLSNEPLRACESIEKGSNSALKSLRNFVRF